MANDVLGILIGAEIDLESARRQRPLGAPVPFADLVDLENGRRRVLYRGVDDAAHACVPCGFERDRGQLRYAG